MLEVFQKIDKNNDGHLNLEEFGQALDAFGEDFNEA
jgi:Ca2+-binding EF-hand superfamily protein